MIKLTILLLLLPILATKNSLNSILIWTNWESFTQMKKYNKNRWIKNSNKALRTRSCFHRNSRWCNLSPTRKTRLSSSWKGSYHVSAISKYRDPSSGAPMKASWQMAPTSTKKWPWTASSFPRSCSSIRAHTSFCKMTRRKGAACHPRSFSSCRGWEVILLLSIWAGSHPMTQSAHRI